MIVLRGSLSKYKETVKDAVQCNIVVCSVSVL